ncbi:MAG: hypothetical protein UHS50_04670 [Bacteroidaceae bacterium]|nr:hypothetical protein [Bacteroidaceae bacterium]
MAKSRVTTNPMYVGGAGGYSFYVRKGEQVIRQRKNNSNYGASASRTYAQMIRRVKWGNLVNVFKAMKTWQPKAYDSKKQGQTDYNIFMQLNINKATAALTREMCLSGCAVIEPCQVSRGSLPPIALALAGSGNQYVSDIVISNAIQGSTTVGQLSTDILANNPQFQEGDNLAICIFYNWKDSRVEWPFVSTRYTEITLDTTSSVVINSIPALDNRLSKSTGGFLQASWSAGSTTSPNNEVGMVLIHTRKNASMLAVSSQEIVMNSNSILSEYVGNTWYQTCIDTYGLTDEVPLDPSFPEATVTNVTANGSAISDGDSLTGSQELRIYGSNLSTRNIQLFFDGVEYVPLARTSGYYLYVIGDNGTVTINVNKRRYMSLTVGGIEVPEELPTNLSCMLSSIETASYDVTKVSERASINNANCLNYPVLAKSSYPYFLFLFYNTEVEESDFTVENSSQTDFAISGTSAKLNVTPEDPDLPVVIKLKGFIVCVANYTL